MRHILQAESIPLDLPLWNGIDPEKTKHVLSCLQARLVSFDADDIIKRADSEPDFVAYLLEGHAIGVTYDEMGSKSILHEYTAGQVISCGRVLGVQCLPSFDIFARDKCTLVYFTTSNPRVKCERCARYVNIVKANLAQAMVELNADIMAELDIRSRRTARGKILAYLEDQARRAGSDSFDISFNRQELADYLGIDRATLWRELGHLQDEGQVLCDHDHFELHLAPRRRVLVS